MAQGKLIGRAHVQNGHCALADQFLELLARDRFKVVESIEVATDNALDFGNVAFRDPPRLIALRSFAGENRGKTNSQTDARPLGDIKIAML